MCINGAHKNSKQLEFKTRGGGGGWFPGGNVDNPFN